MIIPDGLNVYHVDEGAEFTGTNDLRERSVVRRVPQNCKESSADGDRLTRTAWTDRVPSRISHQPS